RVVPITINAGEPTGTYVCSPHTAYVRYAREEIATLPTRSFDAPLRALLAVVGRLLEVARIDDIVHINNWMLSTNLNGGLVIRAPAAFARDLTDEFPRSIIAIRSLNAWSDRVLMDALTAAGWHLLPSRQVYVIDDLAT